MINALQQRALDSIKASTAAWVIGVDEVGIGAWAGPVVVAAVVAPKAWSHPDVRDSKRLSSTKRDRACPIIRSAVAAHAILVASNEDVDVHGVENVRERLTEGAVLYCLRRYPEALIVQDGEFPTPIDDRPQHMAWLAKADDLVPAVSAASVLAKVHRDTYMRRMHELYPAYGFDSNVGYGTAKHEAGIRAVGLCPLHRRSFKPIARFARELAVG